MDLVSQISKRVAKLPIAEQRNLIRWLDWKEQRGRLKAAEERALAKSGAGLAAVVWPDEDWSSAYKAWKKAHAKRPKARRRVLGRSR
jgi:hypothetical protein